VTNGEAVGSAPQIGHPAGVLDAPPRTPASSDRAPPRQPDGPSVSFRTAPAVRTAHILSLTVAALLLAYWSTRQWFRLDEWDFLANRGVRLGAQGLLSVQRTLVDHPHPDLARAVQPRRCSWLLVVCAAVDHRSRSSRPFVVAADAASPDRTLDGHCLGGSVLAPGRGVRAR